MSRNELIDAYRRGRISRRRFVQGMTAVGVSAVAATTLADDLRAAPASPRNPQAIRGQTDDVYGLPNTGVGAAGGSGSSILKPVAIAGAAAAAYVASKLRKTEAPETE